MTRRDAFVGIIGIDARLADLPHQTLRDDEVQDGTDEIRRNVQIEKTRDGGRRVVRVERRKDQVAGQRRLHGDIGRFRVANFTDHDDVRVLPQERAEPRGERDARLRIDLRLVHVPHIVFDRIFDRRHVHLRPVQDVHESVERRRFSGTGRTAGQDHAVRFFQIFRNDLRRVGRHAELLERKRFLRRFKETHFHFFAVERRDDGNADVDRLAADLIAEPPVLRRVVFVDLEPREQLDARDDRGMDLLS